MDHETKVSRMLSTEESVRKFQSPLQRKLSRGRILNHSPTAYTSNNETRFARTSLGNVGMIHSNSRYKDSQSVLSMTGVGHNRT